VKRVAQSSSRTDDSEKTFLLKVLEAKGADDPMLYEVPEYMVPMEKVLQPELVKLCEKDVSLKRDVDQEEDLCMNNGRELTSRKILHMILRSMATDKPLMVEVTAANLFNLTWKGDAKAKEFLQDWLTIDGRLEADAVSAKSKMTQFWQKVRESTEARYALRKWTDKPPEERSYDELLRLFKEWIAEMQSQANYKKCLSEAVSTPSSKAMAVKDSADKPKAKPKPKGKADSANGSGASAVTMADPKTRRPKGKCIQFQTRWGAEGCKKKKGTCRYSHEMCETKEEYDTLVDRVLSSGSSSESDGKNSRVPAKPLSPGKAFRAKFCRFGGDCRNKDKDGKEKCRLDHTSYPTTEKWHAALKKITGADSGSETA